MGSMHRGRVKRKVDIRKCSCYRAVKLLEHRMKLVDGVLKMSYKIVTVN